MSRRQAAAIAAVALVVAVDQGTKRLAVDGVLGGPWFEPLRNNDLALGVGGGGDAVEIAGALLGIALLARILAPRPGEPRSAIALGVALGGALGNLLDRVVAGSVVDFIPAGPVVLNVADVALLVGIAAGIVLRHRYRRVAPLRAASAA